MLQPPNVETLQHLAGPSVTVLTAAQQMALYDKEKAEEEQQARKEEQERFL